MSIHEPSGWQIMKVLELVNKHLTEMQAETDPDADPDAASDNELLLEKLKGRGADVTSVMETLLLAGDEAKSEAEAIKQRRDKLLVRQQRRLKRNDNCRNAALAIMAEFPELFRPQAKSKALATFRSSLVDARVQRGIDGVTIIDPNKLMKQERFVTRSLNEQAVKAAVLDDGEIIDGVEKKNGTPFLVVKVT